MYLWEIKLGTMEIRKEVNKNGVIISWTAARIKLVIYGG